MSSESLAKTEQEIHKRLQAYEVNLFPFKEDFCFKNIDFNFKIETSGRENTFEWQ